MSTPPPLVPCDTCDGAGSRCLTCGQSGACDCELAQAQCATCDGSGRLCDACRAPSGRCECEDYQEPDGADRHWVTP